MNTHTNKINRINKLRYVFYLHINYTRVTFIFVYDTNIIMLMHATLIL